MTDAGQSLLNQKTISGLAELLAYTYFPSDERWGHWGPYLNDRFSVIATAQSYWDAISRAEATLYSVALQYKLACSTLPDVSSAPAASHASGSDCAGGAATLTLQYDSGVDKDLMQTKKQLQLKLNYAY